MSTRATKTRPWWSKPWLGPALMAASLVPLVVALSSSPEVAEPQPAAPAGDTSAGPQRVGWASDVAAVFHLAHRSDSEVRITTNGQTGITKMGVTVSGELAITAVGDDAAPRLRLRFADDLVAKVVVGGSDASQPAPLAGAVAEVTLDAQGGFAELSMPAGTPEIVQNMVQEILSAIQVAGSLDSAATWTHDEGTLYGRATSAYSAGGPVWERRRAELRANRGEGQIDGSAKIALRSDGRLGAVDAKEHVAVQGRDVLQIDVGTTTSLRWVRDAAALEGAELASVSRPLGTPAVSGTLDDKLLDQRIAGLTPEELVETLRTHRGGRVTEHERFLWRSVGLLKKYPELCEELVTLFADPAMGPEGRALIADLLAGAGTEPAQAALRSALALPEVQDEPGFRLLYQRLSLVQTPDADTLAYALERRDEPGGEGRIAATYALGSVAGRRARAGEGDGLKVARELAHALADSEDPAERLALVAALGNTQLPEFERDIAAHLEDETERVRFTAANALRHIDTDSAKARLIDTVAQDTAVVQRSALTALRGRAVTDGDLEHLAGAVLGGNVAGANADLLIDLAVQAGDRFAGKRALMEAILARDDVHVGPRARARTLLEETPTEAFISAHGDAR